MIFELNKEQSIHFFIFRLGFVFMIFILGATMISDFLHKDVITEAKIIYLVFGLLIWAIGISQMIDLFKNKEKKKEKGETKWLN